MQKTARQPHARWHWGKQICRNNKTKIREAINSWRKTDGQHWQPNLEHLVLSIAGGTDAALEKNRGLKMLVPTWCTHPDQTNPTTPEEIQGYCLAWQSNENRLAYKLGRATRCTNGKFYVQALQTLSLDEPSPRSLTILNSWSTRGGMLCIG
mgnify:CR=1 FL=1